MKNKKTLGFIIVGLLLIVLAYLLIEKADKNPLTVAISPYQDIAMIVNIKNLDLEKKYNTKVELQTMNWEDILPSIGSASKTVDVGFGSYIEYLTKYENINKNSDDPILFLYPAYIFKGGGFITYKNIEPFSSSTVKSIELVKSFYQHKIGAQKNSVYEMMLYSLANRNNISIEDLSIYDSPLNDAILATQNGSIDIAAAGLTQITEAQKNGGKVILTMEDLGFADITGFICKKSTYEKKKVEIDNLIKMWFECVDYVYKDLDKNSKYSLAYLEKKAATKYTLEQYKTALSQEYFPKNLTEVQKNIIDKDSKFFYQRIKKDVILYLKSNKIIKSNIAPPDFVSIK